MPDQPATNKPRYRSITDQTMQALFKEGLAAKLGRLMYYDSHMWCNPIGEMNWTALPSEREIITMNPDMYLTEQNRLAAAIQACIEGGKDKLFLTGGRE